jgi:hypothetical protein
MEPNEEAGLPSEPQALLNDGAGGMDPTRSESLIDSAAGEAVNGIFDGICNVVFDAAIDGCAGCSLALLVVLFLMVGTALAVIR